LKHERILITTAGQEAFRMTALRHKIGTLCVNISKTVTDTSTVPLVANRKVHMRFRLAPRWMTLDDLELYKFEFSENFAGFRRFRTEQQLHE